MSAARVTSHGIAITRSAGASCKSSRRAASSVSGVRAELETFAPSRARESAARLKGSRPVLVQVVSVAEARAAKAAGAAGLIAKGSESGGRVGEETALVLLQRLLI